MMLPAIFGLSGLELTDDERQLFHSVNPLGFILFARNIKSPEQVRALTDSLRALLGRDDLPILIDQEGGRVARLGEPHWRKWPPAEDFARAFARDATRARAATLCNYQALALDLAALGITVDCAPVLDVPEAGAHDIIGDRAFGDDPGVIAELGGAVLEGFGEAGVVGVIKHIPGHGRARADSHEALPRVDASLQALERDLAPFRALAGAPMAMTAHIVYEAWDSEHCATLSRRIIRDVIRGQIGFDGLLMSDDLDMKALQGPIPQRAVAALNAGCDVALNCWGRIDDMRGMAQALAPASADCLRRLSVALSVLKNAVDVRDIAALQTELVARRDDLLAGP